MQQQQKDIVKDISLAANLEQELRLSQAQHGVAVLDIYSSEWGNTKALSETFRRLYLDAGSQIHLRFYSVECNSVLESLKHPGEQHNLQRPKKLELCRDTLPTYWESILKSRRGKSKSFFVFYKEGTHCACIEGVDTPKIISYVKDLCCPQKPANECTSNKELLEFWEYYFSFTESEVFWEPFLRAVQHYSAEQRLLTKKEESIFAEIVGAKDGKVRIEALEKWLEGTKTVATAFKELPFITKKEFVPPACAAAAAMAAAAAVSVDDSELANTEARHLSPMNKTEQTGEGESEGCDGEVALHQCLAAMQFQCPSNRKLHLLSVEKGEEGAKECIKGAIDIQTLNAYLKSLGIADKNIWALCRAADKKVLSNISLYGKLALVLLFSDNRQCEELIGYVEDFIGQTIDGTIMSKHFPLGFTAICLCTSDTQSDESFFYCDDLSTVIYEPDLKEGDQVVLPPFSLLSSRNDLEEAYTVKVTGLIKVIRLAETGFDNEREVFTPWYAKFVVKEKLENSITLEFAGNVEEEDFQNFVCQYSKCLMDDEENLSKFAPALSFDHQPEHEQKPEENSLQVAQPNEEYADGVNPSTERGFDGAVAPIIESCAEGIVATADVSLKDAATLTNDKYTEETVVSTGEGSPKRGLVSTAEWSTKETVVTTADYEGSGGNDF